MCLLGTEKGWWQSWLGFPTTPREKSFIPVGEGSKGSILLSFWKEKCYQSSLLLGAGFEGSTPGKTNNGGGWGGRWKQSSMTFQQPQTSPSRVRWGGFSWAVDLGTLSRSRQFSYHWCVLPKYISPLLCRLCFSFCTQNIITFLRTKWTKDKVSILYVCVCGVPRKYS